MFASRVHTYIIRYYIKVLSHYDSTAAVEVTRIVRTRLQKVMIEQESMSIIGTYSNSSLCSIFVMIFVGIDAHSSALTVGTISPTR